MTAYLISACGGSSNTESDVSPSDITIVTPENLTVAASSTSGTDVADGAIQTFLASATAFDSEGIVTHAITNDAPFVFPMGETTVMFTASLSSGDTKTATSKITVADLRSPELELWGGDSVSLLLDETYREPGYSAVDDIDGAVTEKVRVTNLVNSSLVGEYTVTYQVMDSTGNMSAIKTRRVLVINPEAPLLTVPDGIVVAAQSSDGVYTSYADIQSFINSASATDLKDGELLDIQNDIPEQLRMGVTVVTFTVIDSDGFETQASATITVRDSTPPVISLLGEDILRLRIGAAFIDPGVSSYDNVDGDLSESVVISGDVDASTEGEYQLTYNVQDNAGNTSINVIRKIYVEADHGSVDLGLSVY